MPGDKLPDNRRVVSTEHPLMQHVQMRTVCQHIILHSLITFHHANTRGSSLRIRVPKTVCHPRVMSRSLLHLTLTTSTSSLPPTSPILPCTHPSLLSHDPKKHCDDSRRSCGSSDLPQLRAQRTKDRNINEQTSRARSASRVERQWRRQGYDQRREIIDVQPRLQISCRNRPLCPRQHSDKRQDLQRIGAR